MNEQDIDIPCPICAASGNVKMIAHVDEIPYFGEHTQVTVQCHDCGWRQTDFIPAEGKKPGACSLLIDSPELLTTRVVRSSSCTVRLPELDLQVNPGSNSTGYVSNIEGVLNRFVDIINLVKSGHEKEFTNTQITERKEEIMSELAILNTMLEKIESLKEPPIREPITIELLDPHGHSMILNPQTIDRELTKAEIGELPVGPDPAVFSTDDMD
ncbi:MAG TPA: ZPR1 zinc finger domain-containing protein [Poseidonia sp.]|nr:ZPR1 zinc finger domain-containing protein [Poseidonia sp.]